MPFYISKLILPQLNLILIKALPVRKIFIVTVVVHPDSLDQTGRKTLTVKDLIFQG
jgi:hypothetical protein